MNHQALIERSHKQARDKGFYENPQPVSMRLALIMSEVWEAFEAFRKGSLHPDWSKPLEVKESFGVELADIVIRVYDFMGWKECEYQDQSFIWFSNESPFGLDDGTNFVTLHRVIDYAFTTHVETTDNDFNPPLNGILTMVFKFAEHYDIDIEKYIMWKLDYNLNREYLHGKKF